MRGDDVPTGIDANSITPPATAKNALPSALRNNRLSNHLPMGRHYIRQSPFVRTAWRTQTAWLLSAAAGCADGRIKPIVAPGSYVLSARSRATLGLEFADAHVRWRHQHDAPGNRVHCRGTCFCGPRTVWPAKRTLMVAIINGARNITGQYAPSEAAGVPNNSEGFGRVDLQAIVGPYSPGEQLFFWDEGAALDVDQVTEQLVTVPPTAKLLKATLVWTDPPGEGLQSDLDLIVSSGGQERHGNMPPNSSDFDRVNNVEQVVWENIPSGQVKIKVSCNRVTTGAQDFALVVRVA